MAKKAKTQAVLFVVASALDLAITLWGTARLGYEAEFNPIVRATLVAGGPLGFSAFKLGGVVLVIVLMMWLARDGKNWARSVAKLILLLGALIAAAGAWSWLPVLTSIY